MKNTIRLATGTALILLIPLFLTLLALWHWRPGAFVMAFVLVAGGGALTYRLIQTKLMSDKVYLFGVVLAITTAFMLLWMNAAVGGILGDDPANMMYFGVLLVGLIGAVISGLKPQGMSHTMFATAFAAILVPCIALIIGTPAFDNGIVAVIGLHALFAMLFTASAMLFWIAARRS